MKNIILVRHIIFPFLTSLVFKTDCFCQSKNASQIELTKTCFFDKQNRKTIDSLTNKIAKVIRQYNNVILIIDNKKYLTCNLPLTIKNKQIRVTGYILQTFETEKVIATPLKIIKATTF